MSIRIITTIVFVSAITAAAAAQTAQQTVPRPPQMPPAGGAGTRDMSGRPVEMPKGTASLAGSVTSGEGHPMRRATVRVNSATGGGRTTITDDQGNFELKELPAGDFTVTVTKPGYLTSVYGQKKPGSGRPGTAVSLKDGQRVDKLGLTLPRGGVLTGIVTDDVGEPSFGVLVRAMRWSIRNGERSLVAAGSAQTDDRGIYRIPLLSPGEYVVLATPRDDNAPLTEELRGAIEAPIAGANVVAGRALAFSADSIVQRSGPPTESDAPSSGYAPVFYPGTTLAASAGTIAVGTGEEKASVDIQLQMVPLGTVTGTVVGDPRVIQSTTVELTDANTGLPGLGIKTARPGPDGKFSFTGVTPGSYTVTAKSGGATFVSFDSSGGQMRMTMMVTRAAEAAAPGAAAAPPPPAPQMWARAEVAVEGRTKNDVALVMQSGMTVNGRLVFQGSGEQPTDFSSTRVLLASSSQGSVLSGSAIGSVNPDGTFKVTDVMPGRYRVTVTPPRGWRLKSFDVEGRDALDFLLDVKANEDVAGATATFTNQPTDLKGTLQDASGQPASGYTIILFASEERFWTPQSRRILTARPSTDGTYTFRDLPAGDYKLVAVEDAEPDSWYDPNVLRQLNLGAIGVKITEGERKVQDIRIR